MRYIRLTENIIYLISSILAVPIIILFVAKYIVDAEKQDFRQTRIRYSLTEVKDKWGKPDREYNKNETHMLFYDDGIGWGSYVFVFKNEFLILKTFDD